jgi:hypothetical protein
VAVVDNPCGVVNALGDFSWDRVNVESKDGASSAASKGSCVVDVETGCAVSEPSFSSDGSASLAILASVATLVSS